MGITRMTGKEDAQEFLEKLRKFNLTKREYETLKGLVFAGNLDGAKRGLDTIMKKRAQRRYKPRIPPLVIKS